MFFVPQAIWVGAPFGVGYYIWKSLIPTTLGNIVGGGLFVGAPYWYLYLTGENDVDISFDLDPQATAMEAGGPMGAMRSRGADGSSGERTLNGVDPTAERGEQFKERDYLPHSGSAMTSAISQELAAEKYAKTKAEREAENRGNEEPENRV